MKPARPCLTCGMPAPVAFEERIDVSKVSALTYASRKPPELMHYELRECARCRLLFTSTVPDAERLLSDYEGAAFDAQVESGFAARTYVKALGSLIRPGVSVLDVGCGDGEFLRKALEHGAKRVQGIEPSPAAASLAPEVIQKHIFFGGYQSFEATEDFDLITLFQTVEHIVDPESFLREMASLAAPGCHVAIACHDYRSVANRILGEKSPIFDIEHLQVFSKRSIALLLERAGLSVVKVSAYANVYPIAYWLRLAPVPPSVKATMARAFAATGSIPLALPVGNVMAIGRYS